MRRLPIVFALLATFALAGTALAAPNGSNKMQCFNDGSATCAILNGTATLTLTDATTDAGVYIPTKNMSSKPLNAVTLSFTSTGDVTGGAPRLSIAIDKNHDGATDGYAFLDAAGCGGVSAGTTVVSTSSATCAVNAFSVDYANWAAFASANPSYRIGPDQYSFIIADGSVGTFVVSNVDLR